MALDTVTIPKVSYGNVSGPASYASGGFLLDLSGSFANLLHLRIVLETEGSLEADDYEVILNQDTTGAVAYGKAVIKLYRDRYDKASISSVSGNPAGTATQSAKFAAATTTGSSHTHAVDHDHPSTASSSPTAAGAAVAVGAGNQELHTHAVDINAFTGSSGASTHTHDRSFEYEHDHSYSDAETNIELVEVSTSTNLSTTTWRYLALGFGDQ